MAEKEKIEVKVPAAIPPIVLAKKQCKKFIVNLHGTIQELAQGNASWTVDSKPFFAPTITSPTVDKMIPIKVIVKLAKHNLPFAIAVDLPIAKKTVYDHSNLPHAFVMEPNCIFPRKKTQLFYYETKIDPQILLAASKLTPDVLQAQLFTVNGRPDMKLASPWLYSQIQNNAPMIEKALNRRVSGMKAFKVDEGTPMYPVEAGPADFMLKILSEYVKKVPFEKMPEKFVVQCTPFESTWSDLISKLSQGKSVAEEAMMNMPYSIFLEMKYVYAILDD